MNTGNLLLAFMGLPGGVEWLVIGLFGLLIFGKKLPGVARSVGASIVEFKKGLTGTIEDAALEEAPVVLAESRGARSRSADPEG